jgi:antitoxin component YwqK of YwqJK toxin-antitoxin module
MSLGYFTNDQKAWEEEYRDNLLINGSYYNPQGELLTTVDDGTGVRALFEGDTLSVLMQVQQGFIEGKIKHLTPQGELKTSYTIRDGRKHGVETIYFLKAEKEKNSDPNLLTPKITIDWEDQSIHGTIKTWYPTGQLQSQKEFCHNKKMGPAMAWYRNGSLMFVEEYEHDKLLKGLYYKKNALDTTSCVVQGSGTATIYDENGIFLRKISYAKGEPTDGDN